MPGTFAHYCVKPAVIDARGSRAAYKEKATARDCRYRSLVDRKVNVAPGAAWIETVFQARVRAPKGGALLIGVRRHFRSHRGGKMTFGIRLLVSGDHACFTRPEMKVERVSYDVMTPSAARGILEAIHWKPAITWIIDAIHVLKPIRFQSIRRN